MSNKEQLSNPKSLEKTQSEIDKINREKEFGPSLSPEVRFKNQERLRRLVEDSKEKKMKESPEERDKRIEDIKAQLGAG